MPYFIRLLKFTPAGLKDIKQFRSKRSEFKKQANDMGISIYAEYITTGLYDLVTILEAPDLNAILKLSTLTASKGRMTVQTMGAVPAEQFEDIVDSI
jgi:uncharacterized protein with GYD domain